jgi:hypothetical protein
MMNKQALAALLAEKQRMGQLQPRPGMGMPGGMPMGGAPHMGGMPGAPAPMPKPPMRPPVMAPKGQSIGNQMVPQGLTPGNGAAAFPKLGGMMKSQGKPKGLQAPKPPKTPKASF